jgi:pyrroloquinoline quinone biosynthesis protein D
MSIDVRSVPRLSRGVRLQRDAARGGWIVLAPERVLIPDEIAVAVLQHCDGKADVGVIADALAREYGAPRAEIEGDIVEMLQDLAEKGVIEDGRAG